MKNSVYYKKTVSSLTAFFYRMQYISEEGNKIKDMVMKRLKKIIVFIITASMILTLTGCKNNSATKAVDEYLKEVQKSPFGITMWYSWDSDEYRHVLEDMISEIEYKIIEESDYKGNNNLQEKAVVVEITGYDIGGFYEKYLDNRAAKIMETLNKTYSNYELAVMHAQNPEEYQKMVLEVDLEYYKTVMAECKAAGKTYTCKDAKFIAYYNKTEKEWMMSVNSHLAEHIDYITNNLNSRFVERCNQNQ